MRSAGIVALVSSFSSFRFSSYRRVRKSGVAKKSTFRKIFAFPLEQVSIKNEHLQLEVLDYGAIIHKLRFCTGENTWQDMTVGLSDPEAYLKDPIFLGACVGRYAGRLSGGVLTLDGKQYPISNENGITLHGGVRGFGRRYWQFLPDPSEAGRPEVRMRYLSPHLEEGFPGDLEAWVTYRLEENALVIRHEATSDRTTVVNLVNHSYFKIDRQPVNSHYLLRIGAPKRLETDLRLLPTGRVLEVANTPFDFRQERSLGELRLDTPYMLDSEEFPAAQLYSRVSGVRLSVFTNQPCLVVYTPGDFPAICLETQNCPDAPAFPHFPSAILRAGDRYVNESRFVFEKAG